MTDILQHKARMWSKVHISVDKIKIIRKKTTSTGYNIMLDYQTESLTPRYDYFCAFGDLCRFIQP